LYPKVYLIIAKFNIFRLTSMSLFISFPLSTALTFIFIKTWYFWGIFVSISAWFTLWRILAFFWCMLVNFSWCVFYSMMILWFWFIIASMIWWLIWYRCMLIIFKIYAFITTRRWFMISPFTCSPLFATWAFFYSKSKLKNYLFFAF
jgi:hypothetical protein